MDRIIIIKHPESSYSGNRITRTNGAGNSISQQEYKIRNIMPKILMEADDLQPGTAHTILRESVLSHMLR